jgi:hypothetical protein
MAIRSLFLSARTHTHTHTHIVVVVVVVVIIIIIMTDHCLHPPTSVPSPRCTCACACVCLGARELGNVAIAGSGAPGLRLRATLHCGREDVGSSSHRWPVLRRLWYSATKARERDAHAHTNTQTARVAVLSLSVGGDTLTSNCNTLQTWQVWRKYCRPTFSSGRP